MHAAIVGKLIVVVVPSVVNSKVYLVLQLCVAACNGRQVRRRVWRDQEGARAWMMGDDSKKLSYSSIGPAIRK